MSNKISDIKVINTNEEWASKESIKERGYDKFIKNVISDDGEKLIWKDCVIDKNLVKDPWIILLSFGELTIPYGLGNSFLNPSFRTKEQAMYVVNAANIQDIYKDMAMVITCLSKLVLPENCGRIDTWLSVYSDIEKGCLVYRKKIFTIPKLTFNVDYRTGKIYANNLFGYNGIKEFVNAYITKLQ